MLDFEKRIVFMGSPIFGQIVLERIYSEFNIVGVITQTDKQVGRGKKVQPPPVSQRGEINQEAAVTGHQTYLQGSITIHVAHRLSKPD